VDFWQTLPDAVRYPISFLVPLGATLLLTPLAARLAHRYDVIDRPDLAGAEHKTHSIATPYLGGLAVGAGLAVVGVVLAGTNGRLLTVLGAALMLAAVGLADDVQSVNPWIRLGFEATAAVALWAVGVRAGAFETALLDLPLTVLWVVAVVNAFNMIDNMDGIAAGVAATSAAGIAVIAAYDGDYLIASFALATAGAAVGFLYYNVPPARIFLGDAGSMLLGFLIAALTLDLDLPVGSVAPRLLSTVLLAAVPLFDLSVVVIARLRDGRPLLRGSTDHTSHRLARSGHTRSRVLVIAVAAQAGCSMLAWFVYPKPQSVVLAVGAVVAAVWVTLLVVILRMPSLAAVLDPEAGPTEANAGAATGTGRGAGADTGDASLRASSSQ
jgi:UDP-GlcNAc:undecaprenyl-phosphate GlcNAc-1-phosphate transferase